ncbi:MAG: hypothetical protein QM493_00375 [Sulfurovum sp.]
MKKIYYSILTLGLILSFSGCGNKKPEPKIATAETSCNTHKQQSTFAYEYIIRNFEKSYFSKNDVNGAITQLFMVERNAPMSYARNINGAYTSYKNHYSFAKKKKCNIKDYKPDPIKEVDKKVKLLLKKK